MTLTTKFRKDISTLRAAANREIYLDVKYPKLYKKVKRYYEGLQYINLKGEDPDADYNACLLYTSPSPRDVSSSRMPSSA